MRLFRKKRIWALLFVLVLLLLFYNSDWIGRWIYPLDYKQDIAVSARNYEVDPILIASIIRVETNFKPDKISRAGAVGLMQIMPDTAQWIVERARFAEQTLERLHRPDVNIEIGAWYLDSLYNQFEGNTVAVLAAYNAGPGNVGRWIGGGTWDGTLAGTDQIPFGETRHYVRRVLYYYDKYADLYAADFRD